MPAGSESLDVMGGSAWREHWWAAAILVLVAAAGAWTITQVFAPVRVFEDLTADIRLSYLAAAEPQNDRIVIIAITEETLATLPYRSPIDRALLANLVVALETAGVAAIGVDLLFDQATEPQKDLFFRQTLETRQVPVVVIDAVEPFPLTDLQRRYLQRYLVGLESGFANLATGILDGVVRHHRPRLPAAGADAVSFPARLAQAVGVAVPAHRFRIAWHGRPDAATPAFPTYPAHVAAFLPRDWLAGRIALIGPILPGIDEHKTPTSLAVLPTPGVEIHAHVLAQLLDGREYPRAPLFVDGGLVAAMALAGLLLLRYRLPLPVQVGAFAGVLVALWVGGTAVYAFGGPVLPLVAPTLAFVLAAGLESVVTGSRLRRQRQFIRNAFARYVAPPIVDKLVAGAGSLQLGGERREMTFLFTDLADFTSITEKMPAAELAGHLNDYLDALTAVILEHGGTVDKFVGDSVMAFFGAPDPTPGHAARAVGCALALDDVASRFRDRWVSEGGDGTTRIGVHTGTAVVGNFGGQLRFNYTVVGDAVNVASRLEGANKYFGTRICVSEATAECCETHRFRAIGHLLLKGKAEPVLALQPVPPGRVDTVALAAYKAAFDAIDDDPERALSGFAELLAGDPDDALLRFQVENLRQGRKGTRIRLPGK